MKYNFIYLASQSPRRQELLTQIGVRFELLLPSHYENAEALELPMANEKAIDYVQRVTLLKSMAALHRWQLLHQSNPKLVWAPIVCADTTVSLSGSPATEILGKPTDVTHATEMLNMLAAKVEAGRQLVYSAAWADTLGRDCVKEVSMVKAYCGELVNEVMYDCLQFHGGFGYIRDSAIERMTRDARIQSIGGGATEVMLEEVAKRL